MYKLLIVDDEKVIADGLSEVFARFDVELETHKAYSAYEALEIMQRSRIDIVISDIRMPGMDGMQLMEHICRDWPHCKIIFLTGYDDFDYVYQAIQKPGVSYILKTEGYRKVKDMVREAVKQLDDELFMKDMIKQSQDNMQTLETLLQSDYLRYVMKGVRGIHELSTDFDKLNIPLQPSEPVMLLLGVLDIPAQNESYVNRQEAALKVKSMADTFLLDKVKSITVLDRYQDLLWFIQPAEAEQSNMEAIARYLQGTFEFIARSCSELLGIALAVTVIVQPIDWKDLSIAYDLLRQTQTDRVGDGFHMVQTLHMNGQPEALSANGIKHVTIDDVELLTIHLESGRRTEFFAIFDRLVGAIQVGYQADAASTMECYYSIALVLLSHMNRCGLSDKVNTKLLMSFDDHPSWSEGFAFLKHAAEQLFTHRQTGEQNRAEQAVKQLQTYIEEHLEENLSLGRLSELIHFNSSYVSRLFKQVTGVNLSEYIEERRIKKAKELLKTHEYKIAEVGARIGYNAPHSFTRFFKKMTGLTPQEYRDRRGDIEG